MRFGELRAAFSGFRYVIHAYDVAGNLNTEEIHLLRTVEAERKLAKYDLAELVSFKIGRVEFDGDLFPALEVTVRV